MVAVDLVPRQVMLGPRSERLKGRVRLGIPATRRLSRAKLIEQGLERWAGEEGDGRVFCAVDFTVNFIVDRQNPMLSAVVVVVVQDDTGQDSPIIRSVTPTRMTDGSSRTVRAALSVASSLGGPQVERTTSSATGEPYVIADAAGDDRTRWSFTRTVDHELAGIYELGLVVELRAGAKASAVLDAAATVRMRTLGLVRYTAEVPADVKMTTLPSGG